VNEPDWKRPLGEAFDQAPAYLEGLPGRPVPGRAGLAELRAALGGPLPERPLDPREVVAELATAAEPGVVATAGGRYFGFVVGGATPAALAADWLTSAWDQNAALYVLGPAASVVEEVAGAWLAELLGLPAGVSVGLVAGGQMANFTGLAIALRELLDRAGWDVESDGLWGAPRVRVLAGQGRYGTIDRALRFLGAGAVEAVDADDQGRLRPAALAAASTGGAGRRSCAPSSATSTPGRWTRWGRSARSPTRVAPGCMSTGPSGCGRRPARGCGRWSPGWSGPTPGPPTPTSGSTSPTTPAWSSAPTPRPTGPPWGPGPAT